MNKHFLLFDYSAWWIVVILIIAAGLVYLQYSKKNVPWTAIQNRILAALRFLAISLLLLLLIAPSIRKVTNQVVKPTIALALDNSQSIIQRGDRASAINDVLSTVKDELRNQGFAVSEITINDSSGFDATQSDIAKLLQKTTNQQAENNLVAVLLATDGIYNKGSSPLYKNYIRPIYSLGLGDTLPPKDISITRVQYNRVTYTGNETPITVEINQTGYMDQQIPVVLKEGSEVIAEKQIKLRSQLQEVSFILPTPSPGMRRLTVSVPVQVQEITMQNNVTDIFLEVIDGKKKVLIAAVAPHPDIRAIRTTLHETGNYETSLYIPGLHEKKPDEVFDVVIFHGAFATDINLKPRGRPGIWYILNNESSITTLNEKLPFIHIALRGSTPDKVTGFFNPKFSKFKIANVAAFEEYPPVEVPFGSYTLSGPTEVLMYQKLGSIKTEKPLMVLYDDGAKKTGLSIGQNIWKWKLQEAAIHGSSAQFDALITKTVQFLSVSNDKSPFKFSIRTTNHRLNDPILFDVEVYNDIFERIYGSDMQVAITNEQGDQQAYAFSDTEYRTTFQAPALPPGIYTYQARTTIGSRTYTDAGEFSVEQVNPEFQKLTADHKLLRNLSEKSGGSYAPLQAYERLLSMIESKGYKSVIKSEEEIVPLAHSWWWYALIFALFSAEWVLRKYWGGY